MPDPTLLEVFAALADQIRDELAADVDPLIPDLTVSNGLVLVNPTPPAIDFMPADTDFQGQQRFGPSNDTVHVTVRARVNTPDSDAAQELLLSLVDPRADTSLQKAATSDRTLGGKVQDVDLVEGPFAYQIYADPAGRGDYLGCSWTFQVIL